MPDRSQKINKNQIVPGNAVAVQVDFVVFASPTTDDMKERILEGQGGNSRPALKECRLERRKF